jgi:hypothetical protein
MLRWPVDIADRANENAYELYQRGLWYHYRHSKADNIEAQAYFERALAISAGFDDLRLDDFGQEAGHRGEVVRLDSWKEPTIASEQDRRKSAPDVPLRFLWHGGCAPIERCREYGPRLLARV